MFSGPDYDKLGEAEKVALTVAIAFPHRALREILPKLYKWKASDSTYYRYHREGHESLKNKQILDKDGRPTDLAYKMLPHEILTSVTKDLYGEATVLNDERTETNVKLFECQQKLTQLEKGYRTLEEESKKMKNELDKLLELRDIKEKFDFTTVFSKVGVCLPQSLREDVENAIELFKRGGYDSAIVKSYKVSETLLRRFFASIYGIQDAEKVRKHEAKLKRVWNDEQLEKDKYPGIQLVASLLAVVLWYRNKMRAHVELPPSMEAARISIVALLQSIAEPRRLGFLPPIDLSK